MKRVALLILTTVAWCQETAPLPLDQAVALALGNNRLLRNADLEVRKAEADIRAARTYRFPALNFDIFGSQLLTRVDFLFPRGALGIISGVGPIPASDTAITTPRRPIALVNARVSQPLSQLHRIGLGIQLRELGRDSAREKLQAQRQELANKVKKTYYAIVQSQSALTALESSIKLYREMDRLVSENLAQQVVLKSESLDMQMRLARSEYDAVVLRNSVATQKEQLNELMGRDLRTAFDVSATAASAVLESDLPAARGRALEQRPELREARLKIRQAESDRRLKKSEYIPDLSLTVQYTSPFQVNVLPKNVLSAGLMLNWDPFDWGRRKHELASKTYTVEQARNGLEEAEQQVLLDVDHRFRKLQEAGALLRIAELARESGREKVRVIANRFEQKAALLKDVLQTEVALAEADHQYQQSLLAYWTARADFDLAVGDR